MATKKVRHLIHYFSPLFVVARFGIRDLGFGIRDPGYPALKKLGSGSGTP